MVDKTMIGVGIDGREAKKGAQVVKGAFEDIRKSGKKTTAAVRAVDNAIFSLKGAFAGIGAIAATRALVNTAKNLNQVERGLKFVAGSAQGAADEMGFLAGTADELGLNLGAVEGSYVKLAAAAKGTAVAGQETRNIFLGVSKASAALGLSAEQTSGALTAIEQIISKGKVSAEELRGQLGERLPGAFQIAARAMGVTTAELDDMLKAGELISDEFIPKFSRQLEQEFGAAGVEAAQSLTAQFNRLDNAILGLARTVATSGVLDPLVDAAIELTNVLSDPEFLDVAAVAAEGLGNAIKFAADNAGLALKIFVAFQALKLARPMIEGAKAAIEYASSMTTAAAGSRNLVASLVAAQAQTAAMTLATRAGTLALRAFKAALPFGAILLAVEALTAWVFSADEAEQSTEDLKNRVDALANSYKELTGARLDAAVLDVKDRIKELQEAETAAAVAVEQLAKARPRSGEDLEERDKALTRARGDLEQATEDLYKAEALLRDVEAQAAGNSKEMVDARNAAAKAAAQQKRAEETLAAAQQKGREEVGELIANLNEQIATYGASGEAALRYQIQSGELGETLRLMGVEGEAAAEILLSLQAKLDALEESGRKAGSGISDAAREMQAARESANSLIADLQQQVDTFGRTADQVDLYRVSVGDLSDTFGRLPDGPELAGRWLDLQKALRAAQQEQEALTEAQTAWAQLLEDTINPTEDLNRKLGELYELEVLLTDQADALGVSQEQISEAVDRAAQGIQDSYKKLDEEAKQNSDEMSQYAIQAARSIQGAFSDLFFDAMQGNFDGMEDRFKATLDRMVADLISSQLLDFAKQSFGFPAPGGGGNIAGSGGGGGGGFLGNIFGSIGSFFAPGSAVGNTFTVPGSGGHDSTMMLAPVTPGETVRISTPSQEEMAKRDKRGDISSTPISVSMTINTPDAGSFMASQGQIENSMLQMVERGRRNS